MNNVILLDRDGVINVDLPQGVLRLEDLVLEAAALEGIAMLAAAGIETLVCTNQACVGRGELAPEELVRIHAQITKQVEAAGGRITEWFVCPHRAEDRCDCRKPAPGLLRRAQRKYGFTPATTWFVGDSVGDVDAAHAAGCKPALVMTGKGLATHVQRPDVPAFSDLRTFVCKYIAGTIR